MPQSILKCDSKSIVQKITILDSLLLLPAVFVCAAFGTCTYLSFILFDPTLMTYSDDCIIEPSCLHVMHISN